MKKNYLILCISVLSFSAFSQTVSESFETFPPTNWTVVSSDLDEDDNWTNQGSTTFNGSDINAVDGTKYAVSFSKVGSFPRNPDNWLISPRLAISAATSSLSFSAIGLTAIGSFYPAGEFFEILVSTTDNQITSFTQVFQHRITDVLTWQNFSVDLSAYNGQEIYIAFRHYETYDEQFLGLDAVSITDATIVTSSTNATPVANDDDGGTIQENGADGSVDILANDTDLDGNPSPTSGHTVDLDPILAGVQNSVTSPIDQTVWTYNTTTGVVTCNPATNFDGTTMMIYTLCDAGGLCDNATITFTVQNTTGIKENAIGTQVYPNPVKDVLTIQSDLPVKSIRVFNMNGKEVASYKGTSEINVEKISKGYYMLEVVFENGTSTQSKFVKN